MPKMSGYIIFVPYDCPMGEFDCEDCRYFNGLHLEGGISECYCDYEEEQRGEGEQE